MVGATGVVTTHELSLEMAEKIARAGIEQCRKMGFHTTMAVIDSSGTLKAFLRDELTGPHTVSLAQDKAYTALMLGGTRNEAGSGDVAKRMGATPSPGGLAKLPHVLLAQGALNIRVGNEAVGAIGVGGAPGGELDEGCAKAGLDKISARLK